MSFRESVRAACIALIMCCCTRSLLLAADGPFLRIDDVFYDSPAIRMVSSVTASLDQPAVEDCFVSGDGFATTICCHDGVASASCCDEGCCGAATCDGVSTWHDNVQLFFATDGWKSYTDGDDNNNFGFRTGLNTSVGSSSVPVRAQIGASLAGYDFFGREAGAERRTETQLFVTAGVYKRSEIKAGRRVSWAFVWDQMVSNGWGQFGENHIFLSQMRWRGGFALTKHDEIGMWGTEKLTRDFSRARNSHVRPLNSVNLFYKHNWCYGADTTVYFGLSEKPAAMVFGLTGHAPLSSRVALFADAHYMLPDTTAGDVAPNGFNNSYAEEYWNVSFGVSIYLGGNAVSRTVSGNAAVPLLPVANNGTFAVKGS